MKALDRIADNMEGINTTLGMWYARTFPECDLPEGITPEQNAEAMEKMYLALHGVERREQ